ncbi:unnamed protein product [Paramecium sonneborni]|uniref:Uncharacterized protein n=1 Tax=Paramecium sonneborni TaxID=65129 RepID=A0A8S1K8C0_9CILI|nr:unnamed protein product [Paramecium sonneborni]
MLYINKHNFTNIILKLPNETPFLIGIGYPLNYLDCQDKFYKYLQLHKFNKIPIFQRIKKFEYTQPINKLPLCFDTNMLPYFKQLNDTLFKKNRYKLGNNDYRYELNEEIINSFSEEFYNEIHSQIIYSFTTLISQLQFKYNLEIKEVFVNKKPEEHMKQLFKQYLNLSLVQTQDTPDEKRLIYTPGFIYFENEIQ